jgi:hypothetical protein
MPYSWSWPKMKLTSSSTQSLELRGFDSGCTGVAEGGIGVGVQVGFAGTGVDVGTDVGARLHPAIVSTAMYIMSLLFFILLPFLAMVD